MQQLKCFSTESKVTRDPAFSRKDRWEQLQENPACFLRGGIAEGHAREEDRKGTRTHTTQDKSAGLRTCPQKRRNKRNLVNLDPLPTEHGLPKRRPDQDVFGALALRGALSTGPQEAPREAMPGTCGSTSEESVAGSSARKG